MRFKVIFGWQSLSLYNRMHDEGGKTSSDHLQGLEHSSQSVLKDYETLHSISILRLFFLASKGKEVA